MKSYVMTISFLAAASAAVLIAQQPQPSPAASSGAAASSTAAPADASLQQNLQEILEEPESANSYRYDPQGRRDPFRSLVGPTQKISRENAPPGPAGFLIDELDLQGIITSKGGLVAMVQGPDNNGYLLRPGDKVFDGLVVRVTANSVVFRQEVNDPTRIERYREVVKEIGQAAGQPKR